MSPTSLAAYLVLFASVGFLFLFVALLLGRFLRAHAPTPEKLQAYECGEPPVGTPHVQFDLRFYVIALVFIIFEVEVALFFPPAAVFGKATQLMSGQVSQEAAAQICDELGLVEQGEKSGTDAMCPTAQQQADGRLLALASMADLGVFFAVILLGFAYVWYRGDLDWVRAVSRPEAARLNLRSPETVGRIGAESTL